MKGARRCPRGRSEGRVDELTGIGYTSSRHSSTRSRSWRWRRCFSCKRVEPAGRFDVAETYRTGWGRHGTMLRSCPHCGAEGRTNDFQVVRERRAS